MNKERIYLNVRMALVCLDTVEKEFRENETRPELLREYHDTHLKVYNLYRSLHEKWEMKE